MVLLWKPDWHNKGMKIRQKQRDAYRKAGIEWAVLVLSDDTNYAVTQNLNHFINVQSERRG